MLDVSVGGDETIRHSPAQRDAHAARHAGGGGRGTHGVAVGDGDGGGAEGAADTRHHGLALPQAPAATTPYRYRGIRVQTCSDA